MCRESYKATTSKKIYENKHENPKIIFWKG